MCEAFTLIVFFWFARTISSYAGAPLPVGVLILAATAPLLQPQWITFAVARTIARRHGPLCMILAGAGIYVGTEWLVPKLFGDTLGQGLFPSARLRQAADLAGTAGLTFVLIAGNECGLAVYTALREKAGRAALAPALSLVALVSGFLIYGEVRLRQFPPAPAAALRVGVVQGNLGQYSRLAETMSTYDAVRMILDLYFDLSSSVLASTPLDLLVWPETVYPTTFGVPKSADGAAFDREIAAFVAESRVPLLFGAYDVEDGREFNAAVLLTPGSPAQASFDTYRKTHLFPFTERLPSWLDNDVVRGRLPWAGQWHEGPGAAVLPLVLRDGRELRLAPLICYDAIDTNLAVAAVRQGASVIVTLSNDSWFADGPAPWLTLVLSAFRSIETRRPQVRSTPTGVSAFISPTGELTHVLDWRRREAVVGEVIPVDGAQTLMLAWGDWFGRVALLLGLAALALALARPN